MSKLYSRLPSEILGITDEYTAYCLNEACAYIRGRIEQGDSPRFRTKYRSFTDMYKSITRG